MEVYDYLENEGGGPDNDEHAAAVKTSKDVGRAVNLASVDFIEQRHHDENVKDERVVLRRRAQVLVVPSAIDVQKPVTFTHAVGK